MKKIKIGQSTDIHQLAEGLPLILGGVVIESEKGCVAHSDGDILVHAIVESIIGAMGKGDLGTYFSDTEIKNYNRSSLEMLDEIREIMKENGYQIGNIDSLLLVEQPKLEIYKEKMKENIAIHLQIEYNLVNIKATRGEKIGFIGRGEGIVAQAVTLLEYNGHKK